MLRIKENDFFEILEIQGFLNLDIYIEFLYLLAIPTHQSIDHVTFSLGRKRKKWKISPLTSTVKIFTFHVSAQRKKLHNRYSGYQSSNFPQDEHVKSENFFINFNEKNFHLSRFRPGEKSYMIDILTREESFVFQSFQIWKTWTFLFKKKWPRPFCIQYVHSKKRVCDEYTYTYISSEEAYRSLQILLNT